MRWFFLSAMIIISAFNCYGQRKVADGTVAPGYVYVKADQEPVFKGGHGEWIRFLSKNMFVPDSCSVEEIQSMVVVRCIVFKTGKVGNVAIIRGGSDCCNKNFIRLIELSNNKWIPAVVKGKFVNCYKEIPIIICLSTEQ
ncbi:MAG: hypothetical protein QM726_22110 [Chitinophagaceae bacterium]